MKCHIEKVHLCHSKNSHEMIGLCVRSPVSGSHDLSVEKYMYVSVCFTAVFMTTARVHNNNRV